MAMPTGTYRCAVNILWVCLKTLCNLLVIPLKKAAILRLKAYHFPDGVYPHVPENYELAICIDANKRSSPPREGCFQLLSAPDLVIAFFLAVADDVGRGDAERLSAWRDTFTKWLACFSVRQGC